jgi:hypothetical protein
MDTNIAQELLEQRRDFEAAAPVVDVEGMSSPKMCEFLRALVARMEPAEVYLEVGTWKGRTLLSAAHGNLQRVCVGCDKFRFWGKFTGPRFLARRAFYRNVERYRATSANIVFHEMTSEQMFAEGRVPPCVGVYFYDGDHSYEGTHRGITSGVQVLSPRAVVLVDDWNDPVIRSATRDAFAASGTTILWERELPGDHTERSWWNGVGVFFVARAVLASRAA